MTRRTSRKLRSNARRRSASRASKPKKIKIQWGPAIDYDTRIALGLPVHGKKSRRNSRRRISLRRNKVMTRRTSRKRNSRNLHPNPSTWSSGDTTVSVQYRDKSGSYDTTVRSPDGSRKIVVGRAPADRTAVDSEAAYKSAAHAAISFAIDEGLDCQPDYGVTGGYVISRSKKLRRNSQQRVHEDCRRYGHEWGQWQTKRNGDDFRVCLRCEDLEWGLRGFDSKPVRKNSRRRKSWSGPPPPHMMQPWVAPPYNEGRESLPFLDPADQGTNREGLTWNEWRAAAGTGGLTTAKLLAAWRAGEDPTEYRALRRNSRPSNLRSKSTSKQGTNREGLTWREWANAAAVPIHLTNVDKWRRAWRAGEDPTEYRAMKRNGRRRSRGRR